ncbi:external alternative NAD(P)H-ubiquinone oxidoreductase B1, mitochondrial-like [Magnolia sinica]|uniref:external alternative NAD(P)H-ubiquinone oxidoreductase B1, mitochondrial-like n=1 Tax=Magnolia sinica TaxID=86752 RepID=UPI00265AEFD7|nr:external alternative NAD(P)H-ubiquinone oxidoreductase B1, mitochondrial-like [Magnolia sinica]
MRFFSFFDRSTRAFQFSKLTLLFAVNTGGLVAYSESKLYSDTSVDLSQVEPKKKRVVVLGTGWAGTTFLKNLDSSLYDIQVVSPLNYFAFTPLLPSVTCGTVEARSIVEPIRNIIKKKNGEIQFWEAECVKIDAANKRVHCRSNDRIIVEGKEEFLLDYDYLVIAIGALASTLNIPGVKEHCHFLKDIEDAQKIRRSVIDCFERASLPNLSEEERKTALHFIIVGGGPTGVEFAAELHDFVCEDLVKMYPTVQNLVKITVIQSGDHILNTYDERISLFAERKFQRDGIEVQTGQRVISVSDKAITTRAKVNGQIYSMPYGMIVWSTGIRIRPVLMDFMQDIGQKHKRALTTDEWLRVKGCDGIYALGDCATIHQRKIMEDISAIFNVADKDKSGTLTVKEFQGVIDDILVRYPQVEHYLKRKHMRNVLDLLNDSKGNESKESIEVDIEGFRSALSHVDSKMKNLPPTAQVAAQQGAYLARCFNHMKDSEDNAEGPLRFRESGRHQFQPFRYKHFWKFVPLGGEQAALELPGDRISIGHSTQWLWYSVYASKQVSWRTRSLVVSDWTRRFIFGRDSSRI